VELEKLNVSVLRRVASILDVPNRSKLKKKNEIVSAIEAMGVDEEELKKAVRKAKAQAKPKKAAEKQPEGGSGVSRGRVVGIGLIVLVLLAGAVLTVMQSGQQAGVAHAPAEAPAEAPAAEQVAAEATAEEVAEAPAEAPAEIVVEVVQESRELPEIPDLRVQESEGGIPYDGSVLNVSLPESFIGLYTTGPVSVTHEAGQVYLPGATDVPTRGSVVVMYHELDTPQRFVLNGLEPAGGWYAQFKYENDISLDEMALAVARFGAKAMADPVNRNCTGDGCAVVDVVVVKRNTDGVDQIAYMGELFAKDLLKQ
jgi:hypothetical protein